MSKPVKVYNIGTRPVVYKRDRNGVDAIHPGKFLTFNAEKANGIIDKFKDACTKEDHEKHLEEVAKNQADINKKTASEAKEKAKVETDK